MLSCSGADGSDGINGTDGKDANCVFEPKPKTDSLLIICNDKLVGTIANGKIGADGRDGIDGANGIDGIDGRDGADGINGIDGADGVDGRDGADGVDGIDGKNGVNGINGKDGVNGKDGAAGINGKDGVNGKNGADGQNCDVVDSGAYFVMRCGGVEKAKWAKAICETEAYDPAEMDCYNNVLLLSFIDSRDNRKYKAVTIGSQTWMAENLKFNANDSFCYEDSDYNCYIYGRLYDWAAAKTGCPSGWHLPNDEEWLALINFIDASVAAIKLKAREGWDDILENPINIIEDYKGTDDYSFSALPGGRRNTNGFYGKGNLGYWQSATEVNTETTSRSSAFYMNLFSARVTRSIFEKTSLLSVRCVKD
jgi:uncharacterized protein (TIGR02145 family)